MRQLCQALVEQGLEPLAGVRSHGGFDAPQPSTLALPAAAAPEPLPTLLPYPTPGGVSRPL